jgi:hypothetical protein
MKRKFYLMTLIFTFLIISNRLIAQDYWQKTYPYGAWFNSGVDVQETSDGGFIFLGNALWPGTSQTRIARLLKITPLGDIQWEKDYELSIVDWVSSVRETSDGGFVISGSLNGGVSIIKTNINGDTLFTRIFQCCGSTGPVFIRIFPNGDYLLGGEKQSQGNNIPFLIRANQSGDMLWSKDILNTVTFNATINDIEIINDNEFIYSYNDVIPHLTGADGNGETLWTNSYYNSENGNLLGFTVSGDGKFATAGYTSDTTEINPFIAEVNISGDFLWSQLPTPMHCQATSIEIIPDGYIVGMTSAFPQDSAKAYFYKIGMTGEEIWKTSFPARAGGPFIVYPTTDGGFIGAGTLNSEMMLIKTDALGEITSSHNQDAFPAWEIFPNPASDIIELTFGIGLTRLPDLNGCPWMVNYSEELHWNKELPTISFQQFPLLPGFIC